MENKEKIIERIMKLLDLSNEDKNSNPHERESASRKAAEMMASYSIDFTDLRSGKPKGNVFITVDVDGSSEKKVDYEATLAFKIAKTFDCQMINTWRNGPWQMAICGTKHDLEIAVFFFKYIRRTLLGMAKLNHPSSVNSRRNYCYGMVTVIGERLEELFTKREEFIPSDCKAMVLVKKDDLTRYFADQFPNRRAGRRVLLKGDIEAYHQGRTDGHTVSLSRPISHNGDPVRVTI